MHFHFSLVYFGRCLGLLDRRYKVDLIIWHDLYFIYVLIAILFKSFRILILSLK